MSASFARLERLLATAVELPSDELPAFIENACGGDPELKAELADLVEAHHSAEGYFEGLAGEIATGALMELEAAARPKVAIGPYRASQVIGRGGMGVVYRAQRVDGEFSQEVAIKLLHLDLESTAMQDRFRAERQLLAGLNHPNIARLLDGGVTEEGRAYFVMEYVEGLPITSWCREQGLGVRATLELFQQVIEAVSYLHRNLVVHRDLKPGNILIDREGRVKLIDFGIAKLLAESDGGQLTRTSDRQLTPAYAAPEQLVGGPITTATDVYALGAVLYEMLSGSKPHGDAAGAASFSRGAPTAPSSALRARGRSRDDAHPAPHHSWRRLACDLDDICLMALRPEPERRYASAEQLGEDIARHLSERPTRAGKGTLGYRVSRFTRRNRAALVVAGLVLAALTFGLARERSLRGEAERAHDLTRSETAKAQAVSTFLADLLASADPNRAQGEDLTVREMVVEAAARIDDDEGLRNQPGLEAALRLTLGRTFTALGQYDEAAPQLERAVDLRRNSSQPALEVAEAVEALGVLHQRAGNFDQAEAYQLEAVESRRRLRGDDHPDTLTATSNLANLYWYQRRYDEVEVLDRRTLDTRRRVLGDDHPDTLKSINGLGTTLFSQAEYEEASDLFGQAAERAMTLLGEHHPDTLRFRNNLAASLSGMGHLHEAEPVSRAVVAGRRRVLGEDHQDTGTAMHNLALLLMRQAKYEEAEQLLLEAMRIRATGTNDASAYLFSRSFLADIYRQTGRAAEAREIYRSVLDRQRSELGPAHSDALRTASSLAALQAEAGELALALALAESTLEAQLDSLGPTHPDYLTTRTILAGIHRDMGELARAEDVISQVLEVATDSLNAAHPVVLQALEAKALVFQAQGRLGEAGALVERLARELNRTLGSDHPRADRAAQWAQQLSTGSQEAG